MLIIQEDGCSKGSRAWYSHNFPLGPATIEENHLYNSKAIIKESAFGKGNSGRLPGGSERLEFVFKRDLSLIEATKQQFQCLLPPGMFSVVMNYNTMLEISWRQIRWDLAETGERSGVGRERKKSYLKSNNITPLHFITRGEEGL